VSNRTKAELNGFRLILVEDFLLQKGMSFAVPQISWRRADQFGNFVTTLKFSAVDFDHRARILQQGLRVFPDPGDPRNRKFPMRQPRGIEQRICTCARREALFSLRTKCSSHIVIINSLTGSHAFAGGVAYNASKLGLNGFFRSAHTECKD
jgi:hypothetical protein